MRFGTFCNIHWGAYVVICTPGIYVVLEPYNFRYKILAKIGEPLKRNGFRAIPREPAESAGPYRLEVRCNIGPKIGGMFKKTNYNLL